MPPLWSPGQQGVWGPTPNSAAPPAQTNDILSNVIVGARGSGASSPTWNPGGSNAFMPEGGRGSRAAAAPDGWMSVR